MRLAAAALLLAACGGSAGTQAQKLPDGGTAPSPGPTTDDGGTAPSTSPGAGQAFADCEQACFATQDSCLAANCTTSGVCKPNTCDYDESVCVAACGPAPTTADPSQQGTCPWPPPADSGITCAGGPCAGQSPPMCAQLSAKQRAVVACYEADGGLGGCD